MKPGKCKFAVLSGVMALAMLSPGHANAQLLGNMRLNQEVDADNDFPLHGNFFTTPVTDTAIPFQTTVSANDATGAYVTASYSLSDNGSTASISISASGLTTANGNYFEEATGPSNNTLFNLLKTSTYTATIGSSGQTNSEFDVVDGSSLQFELFTAQSSPTDTISGVMAAGPINFFDEWGALDYNDAPQPADESGTYSLTLTFTAIPEPSSATLLAISAAVVLCRRRRRVVASAG